MKDTDIINFLPANVNFISRTFSVLLGLALLFGADKCCARQLDSVQVTLSPRVLADTSNASVREVLGLWTSYLNSRPDSVYDNPYWSLKERQHHKHFDLTGTFIYRGIGSAFLKLWKPVVLSIDSVPEGFVIQTAYIQCDTDYFEQALWAVQLVLAKRENGNWRLFNVLPSQTVKLCFEKQIGRFKFFYSKGHNFNEPLARKSVAFTDSIATLLSIPLPDAIEYYLTDNISELTELMGMPFCLSMSTGTTSPEDRQLFTACGLEYYPHEITHILLPASTSFASEGVATWLGGTGFKEGSLENSIPKASPLAEKAAEMPLDTLITTEWHFRSKDLFYVTGGMVAALVYQAKGERGIKKLVRATQAELSATIENLLDSHRLTVGQIWNRYNSQKSFGNEPSRTK